MDIGAGENLLRAGFGLSEPQAGSDVMGMRTKAVADKPPILADGATVFLRQPADRVTREATFVSYDVRVPARLMAQMP